MNRNLLLFLAAVLTTPVLAGDIKITNFRYAGPYQVQEPVMLDSVNLSSESYKATTLIDTPLKLTLARQTTQRTDSLLPETDFPHAIGLLQADIQTLTYAKATISVKYLKNYQLYVDGSKTDGKNVDLLAGNHEVVIKYLSEKERRDTVVVTITSPDTQQLTPITEGKRLYTLSDVTDGTRIQGVSLSPDGSYLITRFYETLPDGTTTWRYVLTEPKTGRKLLQTDKPISWMPRSSRYYYTERGEKGQRIIVTDPATNNREILAEGLSNDRFQIMPDERHLLITHQNEAPKHADGVYEISEPDDRQPGWRKRSTLLLYDMESGLSQTLTYGYHNIGLQDISEDGRYLLLLASRSRLTERPTTLYSLVRIDLTTLQADTLIHDDGFLNGASFSPDGTQILVKGSPESFSGIGKNVPEGSIPSMTDLQLYLLDIASRNVTVLTRDFNPSVQSAQWSTADNQIYFTAEDRDCINLFRLNPKTQQIVSVNLP